jgi:endo-1,4-beta-xylanase
MLALNPKGSHSRYSLVFGAALAISLGCGEQNSESNGTGGATAQETSAGKGGSVDAAGATAPGGNAGASSNAGNNSVGEGGALAEGGIPGAGGVSGSGGAGNGGTGGKANGGAGNGSGGNGGGGVSGSGGSAGSPPGTLRAAADSGKRLIGVAVGAAHLSEAAYASAAKEFNFVTPENEMKWDATEPVSGQFSFADADKIVLFATQNGMKVKGHTLVWHSQLPAWVSSLTTADSLRKAMTNHISGVIAHFKGKVTAWDVVNEAWNDDGGSLRTSVFQQKLGNGYIDEAFQAAHAADPSAKLYYNDYSAEGNSAKANAVYIMVTDMKNRGIPIDGVGLQMHTKIANANPSIAQLKANMDRLTALGLDVLISEMDTENCGNDNGGESTRYHDLVAACVAEARCTAVTLWGVTDKYSWLNGRSCAAAHGLVFDDNYAKKAAYTGLTNALLGK